MTDHGSLQPQDGASAPSVQEDKPAGHTPGPWISDEAGIVADEWGLVCNIGLPESYWDRGGGDPTLAEVETMEANARLIEAVHDLLAMVQEAAKQFRFYQAQHAAKDTPEADAKAVVNADLALRCEAAISRALGEQA